MRGEFLMSNLGWSCRRMRLRIGAVALLLVLLAVGAHPLAASAQAQPAAAPSTTAAPAAAASTPAAPAAATPATAAPAPAAAPTAPYVTTFDKINSGDTAWMLTSTALVLMMTIPGLALFYAGMVRKKNVLATLMQSFAITCLVTVLWWLIGYSLAFTPGSTPYIGGLHRIFMNGVVYMHDCHEGERVAPGHDHPRDGLCDVPGHLCDHHAGADLRLVRRAHEVLGDDVVHGHMADRGVLPGGALDVGALGLVRGHAAGLRRRHGGAHQRRYRRVWPPR